MDWLAIISLTCSVLLIPALGILLKRYDQRADKRSEEAIRRSDDRDKARAEAQAAFNGYLLEGIITIGDLSQANAKVTLSKQSAESLNRLEIEDKNYTDFRKKIDAFKTKQTLGTLQH